ncbi:MAG TPA: acyltransferase [Archangium sp.]|jgi:maltose O-acetyltransferase|uniref:acyltransferase n=1 Tax=Archangium sp. TaxID=1872627 RepID=UPI002ED80472
MNALVPTRNEFSHLLRNLSAGPTEARRILNRAMGALRAQRVLRRCTLEGHVYVGGNLHCVAEGNVTIGERVHFFDGILTSELLCHPGAHLSIGERCKFNYGFSIEAHQSVRIGRRCMIASMVRICDGQRGRTAPVVIGDDVWIAHGAIIEPGVEIGEGSVVSAGSVVTTSVPPAHLAIGNPARVLRLETVGSANPA